MRKRYGGIILIVVGALLLTVSLGLLWFTETIAEPEAVDLPETIAGLPLVQSSYGREAVAEVARLHDKQFPLSSGAFGMYRDQNAMVMLWVTGAPMQFMAARMLSDMERSIAEGESPFTPIGVREISGRKIYELTGTGQRHFYFRSGSLLIWVAADEPVAEVALVQVLAAYP
ncbi:MAG: hypothetical protein GXP42_10430 [Chloroflexi bacterium]|nr:hypothetical protein [Chloroflexota bacterium]